MARMRSFLSNRKNRPRIYFGVLALAVILYFATNSASQGSTVTVSKPRSSLAGVVSKPSFYVHVVGQVKEPGVYSLEVGSRLFDAVVAAGGFLPDADQASVNLARPLTDGEQIAVLKIGASSSSTAVASGEAGQTVSLNRATQAELEALPGVGPALAGRIIDWRQANGGFKKKDDLLKVGGIGQKLFAGLSKLIGL